jgi:hypothetical protein
MDRSPKAFFLLLSRDEQCRDYDKTQLHSLIVQYNI